MSRARPTRLLIELNPYELSLYLVLTNFDLDIMANNI
jgi:hypothetical protein